MNTIQSFMLRHPLLSVVLILPFTMVFILAVFSLIINIVLPGLLALWLAGWVTHPLWGNTGAGILMNRFGLFGWVRPFFYNHYRVFRVFSTLR